MCYSLFEKYVIAVICTALNGEDAQELGMGGETINYVCGLYRCEKDTEYRYRLGLMN